MAHNSERKHHFLVTGRKPQQASASLLMSSNVAEVIPFTRPTLPEREESSEDRVGNRLVAFYERNREAFQEVTNRAAADQKFTDGIKSSEDVITQINSAVALYSEANPQLTQSQKDFMRTVLIDNVHNLMVNDDLLPELKQYEKKPFELAVDLHKKGIHRPDEDVLTNMFLALGDKISYERNGNLIPLMNAREPLAQGILAGIRGSSSFLRDFSTFMQDEQYVEARKDMKVVLKYLLTANSNPHFNPEDSSHDSGFDAAVKELQERLLQEPEGQMYDAFLTRMMLKKRDGTFQKIKPEDEAFLLTDSKLHEYLLFGLAMEAKRNGKAFETTELSMTLDEVREVFPAISFWPPDMRQEYTQFVRKEIAALGLSVSRLIKDFVLEKPSHELVRSIGENAPARLKRRHLKGETHALSQPEQLESEEIIFQEKEPHTLAIFKRDQHNRPVFENVPEADTARIIQKRSHQYGGNPTTRQIIIDAISELMKNPLRKGTESTIREVRLHDGTKLDVRSFAIKVGSNLGIPSYLPKQIRVVYLHDVENRRVILHGIGDHQWYERALDDFNKK